MTAIDTNEQFVYILKTMSAKAFAENKYFDALECAIAAHIATRGTEENKTALFLIGQACDLIRLESTAKSRKMREQEADSQFKCSFCGKGYSDADAPKNLVAGPNVFICRPCVKSAYDVMFQEHK